jgi:sterol desaturase/sphingolipid hydroxylase (fatty acid hydroxylase superfamily)
MWVTLAAFWILLLAGATRAERRHAWADKRAGEWLLDGVGLAIQGALVPLVQTTLLVAALWAIAPGLRGSLHLPGNDLVVGFILNFVAVDYLYYWNHRLLHSPRLWPLHQVHHSVRALDVVATSRNTAWTSFLIVYLWVNGALLYLLADARGYALGAALTAALDLWRHSELSPRAGGLVDRTLGRVLVLPRHHAWHHATEDLTANFGANWSLWDRLHGTLVTRAAAPPSLGVAVALPLWRQLLWPFGGRAAAQEAAS